MHVDQKFWSIFRFSYSSTLLCCKVSFSYLILDSLKMAACCKSGKLFSKPNVSTRDLRRWRCPKMAAPSSSCMSKRGTCWKGICCVSSSRNNLFIILLYLFDSWKTTWRSSLFFWCFTVFICQPTFPFGRFLTRSILWLSIKEFYCVVISTTIFLTVMVSLDTLFNPIFCVF